MTIVITRLFADESAATNAYERLRFKGLPAREMDVIVGGGDAAAAMEKAGVHPSAIESYGKGLAAGGAVLVARTTYRPLGAAKITREVLARRDTIDVSGAEEEFYVKTPVQKPLSILRDHPYMLTVDGIPQPRGNITSAFGMKMLKDRRPKDNLMSHDRRMSRAFWPMNLVSQKQRSSSVISGGRYMSRAFWPMPLLSKGPRSKSVIPGGALPFSRSLGIRTTMD